MEIGDIVDSVEIVLAELNQFGDNEQYATVQELTQQLLEELQNVQSEVE